MPSIYDRAITAYHQELERLKNAETQRAQNQDQRAVRLSNDYKAAWASEAGLRLFGQSNAAETSNLSWFVLDQSKDAWEIYGPANTNARARNEATKESRPFYVGAAIDGRITIILRLGTPGLEIREGLFVQIDGGSIHEIKGLADLGAKLEAAGYDKNVK